MRAWTMGVTLALVVATTAQAWNEKGHLAIARLAWLKLTPAEQASCSRILKAHPHYEEYLSADKPDGVSVDAWAFMRAAYWPDWVRNNHSERFNKPTWHYFTVAYVPPHSRLEASDLPGQEPNVVTQIPASIDKVRRGTAAERAIYLCWLLHLVGDIHQPLHCASQLCEAFPEGDQGGNLAIVRVAGGMPVRLHFAWDAMLGEDFELGAISDLVDQLQRFERDHFDEIADDVKNNTTSADWQREGFANAVTHVYLKGDLRPCHVDRQARGESIPNLSEAYVENARTVAIRCATKAGYRLARNLSTIIDAPSSGTAGNR